MHEQAIKLSKVIRVFAPGELSTQYSAFLVAKNNVKALYPHCEIAFEERRIREVVISGTSEDEHIQWLTEKDGCIILCHPFQAAFPPDWDYGYFLKKLSEVATAKKFPMFPDPSSIKNDATFSQVKFYFILFYFIQNQ